jgi:hypothetical protein
LETKSKPEGFGRKSFAPCSAELAASLSLKVFYTFSNNRLISRPNKPASPKLMKSKVDGSGTGVNGSGTRVKSFLLNSIIPERSVKTVFSLQPKTQIRL